MNNKLPNFLIVGTAKSGTTSLVQYLEENPEIFISKNKEPRYLTYNYLEDKGYKGPGDFRPKRIAVKNFKDYTLLFKDVKLETKAIGEASTETSFYHHITIPKIKKEIGDPKIIILLRDPVKRAISAYSHLIREERETLSLEEALLKENERINNGYECIWAYQQAGMYYEQVKAFMESFSDVKVMIFEDFIKNSDLMVEETLKFLDIETIHTFNKLQFNKSGKAKNKLLNKFLIRKSFVKTIIKKIIGENIGKQIKIKIQKKNLEKINVAEDTQKKMYNIFKEDISKLEKLLNVNLEVWKKPYK